MGWALDSARLEKAEEQAGSQQGCITRKALLSFCLDFTLAWSVQLDTVFPKLPLCWDVFKQKRDLQRVTQSSPSS